VVINGKLELEKAYLGSRSLGRSADWDHHGDAAEQSMDSKASISSMSSSDAGTRRRSPQRLPVRTLPAIKDSPAPKKNPLYATVKGRAQSRK
jgi:hypothetical protein